MNREQVGIVTGQADLSYARIGNDLARLVDTDEHPPFRAIAQLGYGSVRNLDDLLNLRNVDFAIVQSDVIDAYKGDANIGTQLNRYVQVVATLYREKVHILAHGDIDDIRSLSGRRVNIGTPSSGHNMTARILFRKFGIQAKLDEQDTKTAIESMNNGALDAVLFVAGGSMKAAADINDGIIYRDKLHFLPISDESGDLTGYASARITDQDYNNLVPPLSPVRTLSVTALLVTQAWKGGDPAHAAAERFIERFFANSAKLVSPDFAPDTRLLWCQAELSGSSKGWDRLAFADKWLDDHKALARSLRDAGAKDCP